MDQSTEITALKDEIHLLKHQRDTFKYANEAFARLNLATCKEWQSERENRELEKKHLVERLIGEHKAAQEAAQERIRELESDLSVLANHHRYWQGGHCNSLCRCHVCTTALKALKGGKP